MPRTAGRFSNPTGKPRLIYMIIENLDIEAFLIPLATMDKALQYIPIASQLLSDSTRIRIDIKGPWEDPEIHANPIKRIGKDILETIKKPKTFWKTSERKESEIISIEQSPRRSGV